ncbi:MAG: NAD(P)/FAD-dependent oxidoreductase [Bryobacterales bacterium]|nr:NAD(P)/FAD-dependent oxidoreductase [Bryobacterales bacterium]
MTYDTIVLGAGAAGLFCAAQIARQGRRVALIEHTDEPGRKILISGGGRCNFTNLVVRPDNFLSANPHFAKSALARYTPSDFIALVQQHRIRFHEKTLGQLFCDESARQILDMLLGECNSAGVELLTKTQVASVARDTRFTLETSRGTMTAATLVVATGGLSIPKMGATSFGYDLATQFGLNIETPYPALVPLTFNPDDRKLWSSLAGVSTDVIAKFGKKQFRENMLYTHKGLSGPAILQISSYWKPGQPITIDLIPRRDFTNILPHQAKQVLARLLTARLADVWLYAEGFTMPIPSVKKMSDRLHQWQCTPAGTEGFDKAEVTGGGVSTAELNSTTMEARRVPGLFFIGEVVDVTGHLGGYNFQWAWASAHAAAEAITATAA